MGLIYTNPQKFNSGIHLDGATPLDDRLQINDISDIYISNTTTGTAGCAIYGIAYDGMVISVVDPNHDHSKDVILIQLKDATPYKYGSPGEVNENNYTEYWTVSISGDVSFDTSVIDASINHLESTTQTLNRNYTTLNNKVNTLNSSVNILDSSIHSIQTEIAQIKQKNISQDSSLNTFDSSIRDLYNKPETQTSPVYQKDGQSGYVLGDTNDAPGENAFAEGYGTTASGFYSHAEGYGGETSYIMITQNYTAGSNELHIDTKLPINSFIKYNNEYKKVINCTPYSENYDYIIQLSSGFTTNIDSGTDITLYSGTYGDYSHTEGCVTTASGSASHAEGSETTASGDYGSHAEGEDTIASGDYGSHAEGEHTIASGDYGSHAEGHSTVASGEASHAEGDGTTASGIASHSEGYNETRTISLKEDYTAGDGQMFVSSYVNIPSNTLLYYNGEYAVVGYSYYVTEEQLYELSLDTAFSFNISNGTQIQLFTSASGNYSHTEGCRTIASDEYSHAEGTDTTASGIASHAEGDDTTASGVASHTEGSNTTASGEQSHAEGQWSIASGDNAHAEGETTIAFGNCSHVEGEMIAAVGRGSHAEGGDSYSSDSKFTLAIDYYAYSSYICVEYNSIFGETSADDGELKVLLKYNNVYVPTTNYYYDEEDQIYKLYLDNGYLSENDISTGTKINYIKYGAFGDYSHIEGSNTTASGNYSHAEGYYTNAKSECSHAEGQWTIASGECSHVEGLNNTASAQASHAEGYDTKATGEMSHAEGIENTASGQASHAEGYGSIAAGMSSHAEGRALAVGDYSHAEGICDSHDELILTQAYRQGATTLYVDRNDVSIGTPINYDNEYRVVEESGEGYIELNEGFSFDIQIRGKVYIYSGAGGKHSHSEGELCTAAGDYSHAEGSSVTALGYAAHAEGGVTKAFGDQSHAEGEDSTASGTASHAEGGGTTASGESSHAEGESTTASGTASHAEGNSTQANNEAEHASGMYNKSTENVTQFSVGVGTDDNNRKNAFEIAIDGSVYINDIGGYNGTNVTSAKNIQDVVKTINSSVNTLDASVRDLYINGSSSGGSGNSPVYQKSGQSGYVLGDSNDAPGENAFAYGYYTNAEGDYSHAEGQYTTASGENSHAEGYETRTGGDYSHADGYYTYTSNVGEHACGKYNYSTSGKTQFSVGIGTDQFYDRKNALEITDDGKVFICDIGNYNGNNIDDASSLQDIISSGGSSSGGGGYISYTEYKGYILGDSGNTAEGQDSFAEGNQTSAGGDYSHAEGYSTTASGDYSHAEGCSTTAYNDSAHAEGYYTTANGDYSHAEGNNSSTSADSAHAEGYYTSAFGNYSHTEGYYTIANGEASHAEGKYTQTTNEAEHASGMYNQSTEDLTQFSVGIGSRNSDRKNAFEITNDGNIFIYNMGDYDGTNARYATPLQDIISGSYITYNEEQGYAVGNDSNVANGTDSFAVGYNTTAEGAYSFAEGNGTYATGENGSHAEGCGTTASGEYGSHAEGNGTHASGESSHAEGVCNTASGSQSHAEGYHTTASGEYGSHAEGYWSNASGNYSHTEGYYTQTTNEGEHASGKYNKSTEDITIFSVGVGSSELERKNAFEITLDGKIYIKGIGNYNGKNVTDSDVKAIGENGWIDLDIDNFSGITKVDGYVDSYAIGGGVIDTETSPNIDGAFAVNNSTVSGNYAFACGYYCKATGVDSHAEGERTTASGKASHTEGSQTTASSDYSHAEGRGNDATGTYSHAEGFATDAIGASSHSEGSNTTAGGDRSHAEGYYTQTIGANSHAEGQYTIAWNTAEHACGAYNYSNKNITLFSIGCGNEGVNGSPDVRQNAIEVDNNGNVYIMGIGGYNGKNISDSSSVQEVINFLMTQHSN